MIAYSCAKLLSLSDSVADPGKPSDYGLLPASCDPARTQAYYACPGLDARPSIYIQTEQWGAPLINHLVYARRPSIFRGARAMWTGLDQSGLIAATLQALINRRVAYLNTCAF